MFRRSSRVNRPGVRIRAGLADVGGQFRVELIQPLDGDSTYAESLRGHDGADHIHHVRLEVPHYAVAQARLSTMGLTVAREAQFRGRVDNDAPLEASYFATAEDLGFYRGDRARASWLRDGAARVCLSRGGRGRLMHHARQ